MAIRAISKITRFGDEEKKRSQVFLYASIPGDCRGSETSNIKLSLECLSRIPSKFLVRTALAQFSIKARIAASSGLLLPTAPIWTGPPRLDLLKTNAQASLSQHRRQTCESSGRMAPRNEATVQPKGLKGLVQ